MKKIILTLCLFLTACNSFGNFGQTRLWVSTIRYSATPDANGGTVIPFHIILIYDPKNVEEFKKMSGDEFYKKILDRGASVLERDYQNDIQIYEFHAMPGGKLEQIVLPNKRSQVVFDGMVYAQYQGKTYQNALLDSHGIELQLIDKGIQQKPFDLG